MGWDFSESGFEGKFIRFVKDTERQYKPTVSTGIETLNTFQPSRVRDEDPVVEWNDEDCLEERPTNALGRALFSDDDHLASRYTEFTICNCRQHDCIETIVMSDTHYKETM